MKKLSVVLAIVTSFSTLLSACGGGGSDGAGVGSSGGGSLGSSNVTPTIDLKSASGVKTVAAVLATGLDGSQLENYSSVILSFPATATRTTNCSSGGSLITTYNNADGILSVGDSIKEEEKACAFKDSASAYESISSLTNTATVTSVSGPTNDIKGVFSLGTTETYSGTSDSTETINGVKYRRVFSAFNSTGTVQYTHDGKNTTSTNDDVFSKTVSQNVSGTATVNGTPVSATGTLNTSCSRTGVSEVVCSKHDQTFAGNLSTGAINASIKVTTPLRFDNLGFPVGGASVITQGADTATVEYILVGTVPSIKITSSGIVQTFSYAELSSLSDILF
jgi:hypothetical protein